MRAALLVLLLVGCTEREARPTPASCPERRAAVATAAAELERATKAARAALGEEAATLAWWRVDEAEDALEAAQDAARSCP